jgi:hypothetical protein
MYVSKDLNFLPGREIGNTTNVDINVHTDKKKVH